MTMTPAELLKLCDEADAVAKDATPGPWFVYADAVAMEIDSRYVDPDTGQEMGSLYPEKVAEANDDDMAFIAAARTLVPDLAAALREAVAALDEARKEIEQLKDRVEFYRAPSAYYQSRGHADSCNWVTHPNAYWPCSCGAGTRASAAIDAAMSAEKETADANL